MNNAINANNNGAAEVKEYGRFSSRNCNRRAKVSMRTFKADNANFIVNADAIIFINRGQNYILLDEQIFIPPGGWHKERNVCHDYTWRFVANATPPPVNEPFIYSGNHLSIRMMHGEGDSDTETFDVSNISVGGISIAPKLSATSSKSVAYTLAGFSIAAGKKKVTIWNLGGTVSPGGVPGAFTDITINGDTLMPDGIAFVIPDVNNDNINNQFELTPAITVVNAGGAAVRYEVEEI